MKEVKEIKVKYEKLKIDYKNLLEVNYDLKSQLEKKEENLKIDHSRDLIIETFKVNDTKLLPIEKFYTKEFLEKNKNEFLNLIRYYNSNKNTVKKEEIFRYLVSFTFYYYKDGNFWSNLMSFFDIEEDYSVLLRSYIKEVSDVFNYTLIQSKLSNSNEIVETLKLHSRIPIFYLGSYLQDIYKIYIKMNRIIKKDIFIEFLEEKLINDLKLSDLKTIHNLYKYNQNDELFTFSFEILLLVDSLDKNIHYSSNLLPSQVLKEAKNLYNKDKEYLNIYRPISEEKDIELFIKKPNLSIDLIEGKLKISSFLLCELNIENIVLRINDFSNKQDKPKEVKLNYIFNNENFVEVIPTIVDIGKDEIFGNYEILINNDIVYNKKISYLLLDENSNQINEIKNTKSEKLELFYSNRFYEILSEDSFELKEYTTSINKVLLNKRKLNYLRNKYNKKIELKISSIEPKEVYILDSNVVSNLYVDELIVLTNPPLIEGFYSEFHLIYHNGRRIEFEEFNYSKIGKNEIKILNKDTNRTLKNYSYFYIPDINLTFSAYDSNGKLKPYIYGELDEGILEITSNYLDDFYCDLPFDKLDSINKMYLNKDDIDIENIKFKFSLLGNSYAGTYKVPKLNWFIDNLKFNSSNHYIWKEDLSRKKFNFKLEGVYTFFLNFINNSLEVSGKGYDINFVSQLEELSKNDKEFFEVYFYYQGKKYKEALFHLVLRPIIEENDKLIIHSENNADKIIVFKEKQKIEELSLPPDTFINLDKNNFSGEFTFNIVKDDIFGFEHDFIYGKTFIFNKKKVCTGDKFKVVKLKTKDKKNNYLEDFDFPFEIILIIKDRDQFGNYIANVSGKNIDIYFNLDIEKLTASKISIFKNSNFIPYKYYLDNKNKIIDYKPSKDIDYKNKHYHDLILQKIEVNP